MQELIGFGYWRSLYEPDLPDPAWFIDAQWDADTRRAVVHYLKQGHPLLSWMGYSWCRFRCGIAGHHLGGDDLTDGTYCWPEGLAHYIEHHAVRLPDTVVQHIVAHPAFPHGMAAQTPESTPISKTWWATQTGWNPQGSSFFGESEEFEREYLRRVDQGKEEYNFTSQTEAEAWERMINQLRSKKKASN